MGETRWAVISKYKRNTVAGLAHSGANAEPTPAKLGTRARCCNFLASR